MNAELSTAEAPGAVKMPPMQEALLPGTKAIMKATVEIGHYRRGYLVRYKNLAGVAQQRTLKDRDAAHAQFIEFVTALERECRAANWNGEL